MLSGVLKTVLLLGSFVNAAQRKLIIGGDVVPQDVNTDYVAGLRRTQDGENFCAGALIADDTVITAAHCVRRNPHAKWVSLGSKDLNGTASGEQIEIETIYIHDEFDQQELHSFDFAVLLLKRPATVAPIELATRAMTNLVGLHVSVYGWGRTKMFGKMSAKLKTVDLEVMENEECSNYLEGVHFSMVCAKHTKDLKVATYAGDSGGPLVHFMEENKPVLVGITTWGLEERRETVSRARARAEKKIKFRPSVFARLTESASFLRQRCAGCTGDLLQ